MKFITEPISEKKRKEQIKSNRDRIEQARRRMGWTEELRPTDDELV